MVDIHDDLHQLRQLLPKAIPDYSPFPDWRVIIDLDVVCTRPQLHPLQGIFVAQNELFYAIGGGGVGENDVL